MTALTELREITVGPRKYTTGSELYRRGGATVYELCGCCPLCTCPKSGDVRDANPKEDCCTNGGCACHDEEKPCARLP